ncbi:hypothetical protein [Aquibium oceanicum]|uniref:Uncharacterized protein n=1 Tax=Aquibium oceanicum TaxID=1670800 RepID=A0A1L3SXJ0_9HYPH|nr:hypothetical protein [Aquibium oceanicum]APH74147.1 hypothetical protein BSQ44_24320 [Aquibium oceanicum]
MKDLIVNGLGEVFFHDAYVIGDINHAELKRKIGRDPNDADLEQEFKDLARLHLPTEKLAEHVILIWEAQKQFNGSFARVQHWGGQTRVGAEFRSFDEGDDENRRKIYEGAAKANAEILYVYKGKEVDHFCPQGGEWQYGPNHDRAYTQVEISIPVAEPTIDTIKEAFDRLEATLLSVFNEAGVAIL